ncbi:MAG: deoxyribodipyrimidine photo-lyase [Syntrophobacterales bacterium]|jgi:deoxyribodipyrimidine photo-lyase
MDKRARALKEGKEGRGPVAYWMSRDQRAHDNWALLHAQHLAQERQAPLLVVFCLAPQFLGATWRHYDFMLKGLKEVAQELEDHRIHFHLIRGEPGEEIPKWVKAMEVGLLVTDFDPLRLKRDWKKQVGEGLTIPFLEVDAHNIVPCWLASPKQEWAAYTFRPKIHRALEEFLTPFPTLRKHPFPAGDKGTAIDIPKLLDSLPLDRDVPPVTWVEPGEQGARKQLKRFLSERLAHYDRDRNDPTKEGQSELSPFFHFGQLAPQRAALEVKEAKGSRANKDAFLEELMVRRELSDNYCYYNQNYDSFQGFPDWARKTLDEHRDDEREYLYTLEEFEEARTHDPLWNAAQLEMVHRGKMHGYLRMYWAKKILEWTASPEEAQEVAIYLNDRYELDGRDPNGYVGIAWSLGGVHDRAWGERRVFGKIRYMSYKGAAGKFDVEAYIDKQQHAAQAVSP